VSDAVPAQAAAATEAAALPGVRTTRQRTAVADVLSRVDGFRSAQDLHDLLRQDGASVGLTTVYRHLQALADAGQVDVLRTGDGEAVYRAARPTPTTTTWSAGPAVAASRWRVRRSRPGPRRIADAHGFTEVSHTVRSSAPAAAAPARPSASADRRGRRRSCRLDGGGTASGRSSRAASGARRPAGTCSARAAATVPSVTPSPPSPVTPSPVPLAIVRGVACREERPSTLPDAVGAAVRRARAVGVASHASSSGLCTRETPPGRHGPRRQEALGARRAHAVPAWRPLSRVPVTLAAVRGAGVVGGAGRASSRGCSGEAARSPDDGSRRSTVGRHMQCPRSGDCPVSPSPLAAVRGAGAGAGAGRVSSRGGGAGRGSSSRLRREARPPRPPTATAGFGVRRAHAVPAQRRLSRLPVTLGGRPSRSPAPRNCPASRSQQGGDREAGAGPSGHRPTGSAGHRQPRRRTARRRPRASSELPARSGSGCSSVRRAGGACWCSRTRGDCRWGGTRRACR
jgi:Fur family ferric uptake transcriptional regulator